MKKVKIILLTLILLLMPTIVLADGIENYYINATILYNGDIEVEEYFNLTGFYNGMERIIDYKNIYAPDFNPLSESYGGSSIHNGNGITLKEIRGVDLNNNFNFTNINGDLFEKTNSAERGDYGVYKITKSNFGETYQIYMPSSKNKAFYIKYILHNMAILHNDVAELGWNVVGKSLNENINNLKVTINIPNNNNLIKVWAHGPLNGESKIIADDKVEATIKNLSYNTAVDVRLVFDKQVINNSTKLTNVNALDKIINYETKLADEANKQREEIKNNEIKRINNLFSNLEQEPSRYNYDHLNDVILDLEYSDLQNEYTNKLITYQSKVDNYEYSKFSLLITNIDYNSYLKASVYPDNVFSDTLKGKMNNELAILEKKITNQELKLEKVLIAITLVFTIISYLTLYKNKISCRKIKNVNPQYLRDLPDNLLPVSAGLLINKSISKFEISATLLDLIRRKIVTLEKDDKDNNILRLTPNNKFLSTSDDLFIKMIFENNNTFNLSKNKVINEAKFEKWRDYELNILKNNKFIKDNVKTNNKVRGEYLIFGIIFLFIRILSPIGLIFLTIYGVKKYRENIHIFYMLIINIILALISIVSNHFVHVSIVFIIFSTIIMKHNLKRTTFKINMKLTDKGKEERNKLYAIRNFLNDFSIINEREIPEVTLWEKYLVFATAFGIGEKVLKSMQIKLENQQVEVLSSNLFLDGYICNSIYNSATNISNRITELSMPSVYYSKILTSGSSGSSSYRFAK